MGVRKGLTLAASRRFADDAIVVPSDIKGKCFISGGVDNIYELGHLQYH